MNIHIIGSGSIGLLLAAYLSENHEVTLYTNRKEQKEKLERYGLCLEKNSRKKIIHSVTVETLKEKDISIKADLVFVTVKQYHLPEMIERLNTIQSPCVFLQNGMRHLSLLETLACEIIGVGVITHGALRKNDTVVEHKGNGEIKIGCLKGENKKLEKQFIPLLNESLSFYYYDDIYPFLKGKLWMNAIINPLTALYRVNNGELKNNDYMKQNVERLYRELKLVFSDVERQLPLEEVYSLCEKTKENRSSMLKDIEEGRMTEIDAIVGYILQVGNQQALDLPYFQFVYTSIKALEVMNNRGI